MSFLDVFNQVDLLALKEAVYSATTADVERVLGRGTYLPSDFPVLLSPAAAPFLEPMAVESRRITLLRFGKVVQLYAPLYVSNACVNACAYCGFNVTNRLQRVTLTPQQALAQGRILTEEGFQHILLVSGEDRSKAPPAYLGEIARGLSGSFAGISIEVYPMDTPDYAELAHQGVTGIAVYQETYLRDLYATLHRGPKADFDYRLQTPERAGEAGFRELGIGALMGLSDHRVEMAVVALHAKYLMKRFWKARVSVSFPRLREAEGGFAPVAPVSDRELAQAVFALRMVFPDVDLVLSTRENPAFRDGMAGIGITRMSAGSRTNPGGYGNGENSSLEQFHVADHRSPAEVADMLWDKGLEPIWKDFDSAFLFDPGPSDRQL